MSMEFVMGNSLETLPKTIDFNFEELKGQLAESLALYTGLVVTEDGIKGAKEDRAKLNKLREALENKRKEVKRECMAPYTDFEAKVKELVGLIDQPIAAIDAQLKEYEEKRRAADHRAAHLHRPGPGRHRRGAGPSGPLAGPGDADPQQLFGIEGGPVPVRCQRRRRDAL